MTKGKPAGFLVRVIADLLDTLFFGLVFSIALLVLSDSKTLAQLFAALIIYLVTLALPLLILEIFYKPLFTHYFGGNLGKLLSGLQVTDLNGNLLNLKKALFRYTAGYLFSGVLFGLGFLSIIKDSQKRAWHDKAIGSKVLITKQLWPLGLTILVCLLVTHFILLSQAFSKFSAGPLRSEFSYLIINLQQEIQNSQNAKPESPSINPKVSSPSALPSKLPQL